MKPQVKLSGLLFILAITGSINQGCSERLNGSAPESADIIWVNRDGATLVQLGILSAVLSDQLVFEDRELEILLRMKEEEKLARDVYAKLYEKWKIPVFSNISKAESTHLNAVNYLLQDYGEDYTLINEPGIFTDAGFQELYEQLTSKGSVSIAEGYKAGALIEEMDINDLNEILKVATDENIKIVFENLNKGSRNHLRAFNRHIVFLGQTYTPRYISLEEYNQIINSPHETGNRYRMRACGF